MEHYLDSKHLVREVATRTVAGGQEIAITVAFQGIERMSVGSNRGDQACGNAPSGSGQPQQSGEGASAHPPPTSSQASGNLQ